MYIHNSDSIIIKDCGDIFGRELVCGIADEKTSLTNSTITYYNTSRDMLANPRIHKAYVKLQPHAHIYQLFHVSVHITKGITNFIVATTMFRSATLLGPWLALLAIDLLSRRLQL